MFFTRHDDDSTHDMLSVAEALDKLKQHGITDSEQMVRRWLREGRIQGQRSEYRKEGWRIPAEGLDHFIEENNPAVKYQREIEQLKARVAQLEAENRELRGELDNANGTESNIRELTKLEVEEIWREVTRDLGEQAGALEDAYKSLLNGLFPKGAEITNTFNPKFRRPYVCPFTNKKYGSAEALVRAAIPWIIEQKAAKQKREDEKRSQEKDQAALLEQPQRKDG